jgi:hypothetical protein
MVSFKPGDPVIFRMTKRTPHPGPRAKHINPEPRGECYTYDVDKLWRVLGVSSDGTLRLITRRGKEHLVRPDDPHLRPASWIERLVWHNRFPQPQ